MWYLEHTLNKYHTANLITLESMVGLVGFRTIPCYDSDVKQLIEEQGHMRGLEDLPVMVDTLFLDFDNGESASLEKTKQKLKKVGVGFELKFSGKKGYHLEIKIVPLYGRFVMQRIKSFVEGVLGLSKSEVDHTIYHNCGLIRLDGTIHADTGNPKALVDIFFGDLLEINTVTKDKVRATEIDSDKFQMALKRISSACEGQIGPGERYILIYSIARNLHDAGVSLETTAELLLTLNKRFCPPKDSNEILHQVQRL